MVAREIAPPYTVPMPSTHARFSFYARVAGTLVILCALVITLSAWVGTWIPTRIISLMVIDNAANTHQLQLLDIRPGLVANVSGHPVACCALWSPDGTRIAFTGVGGDVFIWDMRDSTTRPLLLRGMNPVLEDWSPDGQTLLFTDRREDVGFEELYRAEVETGQMTRLTESNDPFMRIDFVQWSPDGRFIVLVLSTGYITRLWDIYRIAPDGENLHPLSDGEGSSYAPQLSPDGGQIAYIAGRSPNYDLFVMDADGGRPRRLTDSSGSERIPLWSPDGRRILFQVYLDSQFPRALEVMNADGTGRRRVADESSFNDPPSWSPDGQHILYEVGRDSGSGLYVVDADGGDVRLLRRFDPHVQVQAAWQPVP
jgi:Tol biopolymer transport system component